MEFLSLSRRHSSARNVPSGEERGETDVFAGYITADQRDVFFFYLAVIAYANSTCKVKKGEDVDDSCSQNFFHSVIYVRFCHQDLRR